MLALESVNQFYNETHILWDVDFKLEKGSFTCLMGRNGVGKTTCLRVMMGLLPARSGKVVFDGRELQGKPSDVRARLGIGYVPQGREIFGQLTVEENLDIGAVAIGLPRKVAVARKNRVFDIFPVLKKMLGRRGGDLSGGQQQQLAIGRALMLEPKVLILDEPCEGIQPNIVSEIGDILMRLNKEGLTVLLVEQKLPFARRVANDFVILERGRVVAKGPMPALTEEVVQRHLTV